MDKRLTQNAERLLIIFLLLFGAGVRLARIGQVPPGLYHDEAQNGLDALRVLEDEFPLYFEANNGREPLFIYLIALSVGILGRSPIAVRLPSFYIGFLTLAAIYNLARALFDRRTARYALAVLVVTFWHIHLSRVAFRAVLLPLFSALYLSAVVRAVRYNKNNYWILGGALYGLSWYTYMAARFTPVAIAVLIIYILCTRRLWIHHFSKHQIWSAISRFTIAAFLVLLPLGLYTIAHPDVVLNRSGQVSIWNNEINDGDFAGTFIRHTLRSIGMFIIRGDRIWRHNLAYRPVWETGLGAAFIMGVGLSLASLRKQPAVAVTLLWTAVMLIPTLLAEDAPHYLRAVGVLPTAALLPALGLRWLDDRLAHWFRLASKHTIHRFPRLLLAYGLPWFFICSSGFFSLYDYFVTYAQSPFTYHWFEAGPVEMAENINALSGEGWDGYRILNGNGENRTVCINRQLWAAWTAVPFLVPERNLCLLPLENTPAKPGTVFMVWPYDDWHASVLPNLTHPSYIYIDPGPYAQGDLDPEPYRLALYIYADPLPPVPPHIAQFENNMGLRAALVEPVDSGIIVNLWWDTAVTQTNPSTVYVHYMHNGQRITQHDGQPVNNQLPTTLWVPGDLILDRHFLPNTILDRNLDRLRIGLYHSHTGENILRVGDNGSTEPWFDAGIILKP